MCQGSLCGSSRSWSVNTRSGCLRESEGQDKAMSELQETIVLEEEEEEEDASTSCGTGEDEDDGEPKICRVCGDKATGYHFNAMTCEGCKGFFRRAMKRNLQLSCPFQSSCLINKSNRRHCQACRLKKCVGIGMKRELIMSDEAVQRRRALIRKKQQLYHFSPSPPVTCLTPEQQDLIAQLVEAHTKTFDVSFTYFRDFRPIVRMSPLMDSLDNAQSNSFSMLPHIADLVTYVIKGTISFAKIIPYFRKQSIEDQIALLKGCALELCVIRFNTVFNCEKQCWECGPNKYDLDDMALAGFRMLFLEPLLRFHFMLKKLNLRTEEYALMQAICLFSADRPGVSEHRIISDIQEQFALALVAYIGTHHTPAEENRFLFAKIMERVTELRSMNDEHSKQLVQIWDIQPDSTPLMREVFSQL
ncbi:nuclear receptor subfamily 1 group I member 2 isoform X2 [Bombina bombina]|uniref:nuclear receptor subfamily 1 group I member 2 isoform X2 n=1 Tax=Bombina bombina TaxID=8345 RepID=UPI00235AC79D|nr:nuclear receptor subfamily 1 group I member 2 isoform X2 [Bombina bombina]